jgi:hypothetical protein
MQDRELQELRDDLEEQCKYLLEEFIVHHQHLSFSLHNVKVHVGVGDHLAMRLVADLKRVN